MSKVQKLAYLFKCLYAHKPQYLYIKEICHREWGEKYDGEYEELCAHLRATGYVDWNREIDHYMGLNAKGIAYYENQSSLDAPLPQKPVSKPSEKSMPNQKATTVIPTKTHADPPTASNQVKARRIAIAGIVIMVLIQLFLNIDRIMDILGITK